MMTKPIKVGYSPLRSGEDLNPAMKFNERQLYIETPLLESLQMSNLVGYNVHLKMENLQPSGSFKLRGLSYRCLRALESGCKHFVSSSGGNAGLAVAYTGRKLGIPTTIYVPNTTLPNVIQRMKDEEAEVHVAGKIWDEANAKAMQVIQDGRVKDGVLIHPFDHPDIWEGHSFIIEEIRDQMNNTPDLVVVAVGGGGLMCGLLQGMHRVGWDSVPILAMETEGADSFSTTVKAGELRALPDITSVAKCLGIKQVAKEAHEWTKNHPIISHVVTDADAVDACIRFLDDHRTLVEPSCGAALAAVYGNTIKNLQKEGVLGPITNIVVIVCGGCMTSLNQINEWKQCFSL